MKTLITALLLICSFSILAQQNGNIRVSSRYLNYGDNYYTKNIKGLKQFMEELPEYDAGAYQKIKPEWDRLRTNHSVGSVLVIVPPLIGTGILISGVSVEDSHRSNNRLITGLAVGLVPTIIGALMIPRENDFLKFVNQFNQVAEGDKLRLSLQSSSGAGIGLYYNFGR